MNLTLPGGTTALPDAFKPDCAVAPGLDKWPDPCTARASWNEAPGKAEVDLAVNPKDPLNVVVASKDLDKKASNCVWSVAQVTKDGGKTWKTVYVGGDKANRIPELAPFACITDPIMVFDAKGVLYYALQAYRFVAGPQDVPETPAGTPPIVGSSFWLTRSKDGGLTWDTPLLMHAADGPLVFHDFPRMLVSPKTQSVLTIWNGVGASGVSPWVVASRDGGESVDPPVTIMAQDSPRGTGFFAGFAATKDGTIYVTIAKGDVTTLAEPEGATQDVFIFKSADDGRTFEEVGKAFAITPTPRQIKGHEFRTPTFVEMAIDATDGPHANRIYTVWPDYRTKDSDVLSAFSDDGGKTWSEPARVNADAKNDQFNMRPTVGPDGTVHVLFYDRSFDAKNYLLDAVHAWSTDGGLTWKNQRITNSSFNGDLGRHQNGPPFIGDYNGIRVAADGTVYAAWGDTRTGVAEIAFARILPGK